MTINKIFTTYIFNVGFICQNLMPRSLFLMYGNKSSGHNLVFLRQLWQHLAQSDHTPGVYHLNSRLLTLQWVTMGVS